MTRKRDLKKRIRDRQAKTGETYTTARRHVLAARDADPADEEAASKTDDPEATNPGISKRKLEPTKAGIAFENREHEQVAREEHEQVAREEPSGDRFAHELRQLVDEQRREPIQVDEVIDVSGVAAELGLACKVLVYERLAKVVEPRLAIIAFRDALAATARDPQTALLRAVVAGEDERLRVTPAVLRDPEFMQKIAAGLTAVSKDGRMIVVHANGYAGMVTIVCATWRATKAVIMTTPEDRIGPVIAGIGLFGGESLFLVYEGRRYTITRAPFVIGRHTTCDLQIRDGHISRKHAAIVQRNGTYYILDLGSQAGIDYRGMRISNKRIEEGDMFKLHEYALRFTFHETDA